ncbi:TPA: phage antirepressor N-terminal domain-containing protein, partial [Serratia marcescens]|nr:phage antirepressor N-terminal domain-containing protein [Serratia marcescens]
MQTITVPFHGNALYVVNHNGEPYTPMRPIIDGMGLTYQGQVEKLKSRFSKGVREIIIPTAGGPQTMLCLQLRKLAAWLATIQPNKVKPEIRDNVIQYQD